MIQYKLLKSKLTGDVYAQQVESHPFTSNDLREKLKKQYGSIAIAVTHSALLQKSWAKAKPFR